MSKYKESYSKVLDGVLYSKAVCVSDINVVGEAVDKADKYDEMKIPMKIIRNASEHKCPSCKKSLSFFAENNYCCHCGQKLDWSKDERD